MKHTLRLGALILSLVMLLSLVACAGKNETWAVDVDGEKIPTGLYLYYQFNAYQAAASQVADSTKDVLKQKVDDQEAQLWIYQTTISSCKRYVAVNREFEKLGIALTDDDNEYIENVLTYLMSYYGETFKKNGIGEATVKEAVISDQKANAIFAKYYAAGGLEEVPEAEIKTFFTTNYASISTFGTTTATLGESDMADVKAAAEKALASINSGTGIAAAAKEYAKTLSPGDTSIDEGEQATDADYKNIFSKTDVNYPQSLRDKVFAAKPGDKFIYDQEGYMFVMQINDIAADTEEFTNRKVSLLSEMKNEEFTAKLKVLEDALTATDNKKAVSYYSPKKIVDFEPATTPAQ